MLTLFLLLPCNIKVLLRDQYIIVYSGFDTQKIKFINDCNYLIPIRSKLPKKKANYPQPIIFSKFFDLSVAHSLKILIINFKSVQLSIDQTIIAKYILYQKLLIDYR